MMTGGDNGADFELNLAPIIDCFTVLITYLLVSASFISLTILDVGVAASGQAVPGPANAEPPMSLMIQMTASKEIQLKLSGGAANVNLSYAIAPAKNDWDTAGISARLLEMKKKWPKIEDGTLSADPSVQYKEVVRLIEELKKALPKIYLAG